MNQVSNKKDVQRLFVRCAMTGKTYLPADAIDKYTGRDDSIFGELSMCGLLMRKKYQGYKIRVPTRLLMSRKVGRILWLSCREDLADGAHEVREARPSFCFSPEGARELLRLHGLKYGGDAGKAVTGCDDN